ncbi:ABC transporter permease [Candidatus Gracilibacteria bacterium]|nr:ABC transporter permease [Candidatus Gracilibacteria bacterium]
MFTVAKYTFLEVFRNHFLWTIFAINIIFILILLLFNSLSLNETNRIFYDISLGYVELSHIGILLFLGNNLLSREIEQRTLYLLFVRPIPRYKILLGKFFGFAGILSFSFFVQLLFIICSFLVFKVDFLGTFIISLATIFVTIQTLLAVLLFLSIVIPQSLVIFATIAVYIVGNTTYSLLDYALQNNNIILEYISKFFLVIFPNFGGVNIKNIVDTPIQINFQSLGFSLTGIFIYLIVIGILGSFIFSKKNFDNV